MEEEVKSGDTLGTAAESDEVSKLIDNPTDIKEHPIGSQDDDNVDRLSGNGDPSTDGKSNGPDNTEPTEGTSEMSVENHVNLNNVDASDGDSQECKTELEPVANSQPTSVDNESQSADVESKDAIDVTQKDSESNEVHNESKNDNDESQGGLEDSQVNDDNHDVGEVVETSQEPDLSQEPKASQDLDDTQATVESHDLDESQDNNESQPKEESQVHEDSQGDESLRNDASQADTSALEETKEQDEDIENPAFENAPEPVEQSQEDHTEALDPFDELLKGPEEEAVPAEKSDASQPETPANEHDADDHHDADEIHDIDDDDIPTDDTPADAAVEDLGEPGEDEEVCLLPDTEREISQADKEKALEKTKLLLESAAAANLEAKDEPTTSEPAETADAEAEVVVETVEEADTSELPEAALEEPGNAEEKDKDADETVEADDSLPPNVIQEIGPVEASCAQCAEERPCTFKLLKDNTLLQLCSTACVDAFRMSHSSHASYVVNNKKYIIEEISPVSMTCSECEEEKVCYFYYNSDGEHTNYCSLTCLHSMMADERHKYVFKRRRIIVEEIEEMQATCDQCGADQCTYQFQRYGETKHVCNHGCVKALNEKENGRYRVKKKKIVTVKKTNIPILKQPLLKLKVISNATDKYLDEGYKIQAKTPAAAAAAREDRERSFIRKCVHCRNTVSGDEKNLSWETMDFCNETCLQRYQNIIGAKCANCKNNVTHTSLGKYCVRFGYDIRQFCCSTCLEEFKKGLKICCYCQRDISVGFEGFLAPVGDKGQFKDFCSQQCMGKFEQMSKNPIPQPVWAKCAVCSVEKPTQIEVGIDESHSQRLCSDPCFAAFKFVNSICPDQCRWCKKYFERKSERCFTIYTEMATHCFCSRACMNVYISNSRHIVPCNWCKVKKYNFDMIRRSLANGQGIMMCSLNCLNLYQVSVNAVSSRRIKCDMCKRTSQAQYHLTMSDATVRNFCTYQCVMSFQGQYAKHGQALMVGEQPAEAPKAVPTGAPRRTVGTVPHRNNATQQKQQQQQGRSSLPVISNVQSLATPPTPPKPLPPPPVHVTRGKSKRLLQQQAPPEPPPAVPVRVKTPPPPPKPVTPPPPPPPKIYNHVLVKTLPPVQVANKATMTKPMTVSKGVSCRPHPCTKECQTDPSLERRVLIPIPVPIYVPVPIAMYSLPLPIPVPIPLPIPTPIFIPTTRNSAKGIMKEITKIHDKMPTDPFEAELLMMAEMVAGDKKKSESDSETDDENDEGFSPDAMDGGNAFGEDMLQMALKMASEYEEPAVDLESAMTASTITPSSHPGMPGLEGDAAMHHHHQMMVLEQQRAVAALRATQAPAARGKRAPAAAAPAPRTRGKRRRQEPPPPPPEPAREPAEKPDANMCLKYTFGVNAWKQWVMTKNAEIEKSSIRRKPFKSEILQLTADELNYSLCLFVKEVRKPNGSEYAPDTIYYLVLGIQQYLFENGRIDNIFTDPYYEKFTECLDEVARKFSVLYNDSQYIVTRVEEEHLWESKQLGAHSPHVLLSTLMFFNTKHFNLVTVEEHMQLSFSHIMKHWKRSPNQPGAAKMPGSRNVLLRFYPPQSALDANSRKKKVYEQQENEENPLRCPVKLYEFYISKCPESVRTRNDVFYLMPERSCVPDSPVWYSTQALGRDALAKMLHRVKMVKEINIALLTS